MAAFAWGAALLVAALPVPVYGGGETVVAPLAVLLCRLPAAPLTPSADAVR